MATAREGNPYEGGGLGAGGKFRKRPFRRTQATPYDRPPTAIRNPSTSRNNGWFSKLVDPAQRLITTGAYRLFSSVFRKRLPPPPPSPSNPPPSETEQEVRDNHQEPAAIVTNDSSVEQQGAVGESDNQMNSSDRGGFTELEKLLKQKTFTRSEIDHLTALLHSKTVDSPVTEEEKRTEVVTSELMLSHEQKQEYPNSPAPQNGIENCLVSTPFVSSSVIDKDVASPAEVAKAYMGSRPLKVSPSKLNSHSLALREDLTLLRSQYFPPKSPIVSIVQRATSHENGFVTPRSRGRSAIYSMARTPYARVYPTSTLKGVRHPIEGGPSSSAQSALDHDMLSGSKKGTLKRRSSVLDNDIGSLGPMRRIRQKSNLITSRGLSSSVSASPLPLIKSGVHADSAQQPSSIMQKPLLLSEAKHSDKKLSAENIDDTMPSTSLPLISSKSSEMASKILQQLDKLVSPKEKSSELKLPTVSDKSPTKLSSSMLRGQALRSIETVDSSKFLDHMRDNNSDGLHENLSADAENLTSPKVKLENGPLKLVAPSVGLVPVVTDVDVTMPRKEIVSSAKSVDSSMMKSISYPPQKSRAFHMSAHEDYLDLDDDVYPNGGAVSLSTEKQMTDSTLVAEKTAATETFAQDMPSASSVAIPFKSSRMDDQTPDGTGDRHIIGERVDLSASTTSSTPSPTFKPVGVTVAAATDSTFGSDKSTLLNGSVAASPSFSFGNKVAFSTELTAIDAPSKELSKPGPIFSFGEKVVSSKESVADAPLFNFVANKNVDKVQQMPLTSSFSVGVESAGLKFGASSDSKLGNSVGSTPVAGATDSMPKAPGSDKADAKTTTDYGFFVQSSELAVSSAASTSSLTSPSSIFSFGHSSNQNNGPHASKASFSSPFPAVVSNNSTSQNMLSCSSLGVSSSNAATVASTSSSMTTSTPVTIASSTNSSLSSSEAASSSPTTSFFKFGSSPVLTTDLPMSSSGKQDAGFSILGSTAFGSSSAAVGSTGNSIFGLSSSAMTTVNSQSQGSLFGSSTSLPGAQAPPATSVFATSTQSQSIPLGSSASSPLFGLSANAAFSSGSSMFPSSSATNVFNSGTSFGLSASASSSAANTAGSNSGTASSLFGLTSWQSSKSPFGSAFSSLSSSGFSFGVSSGSVSSTTSSPMFGSSTDSVASTTSSSMFGSSTGSVASATSSPIFGSSTGVSSSPMFSFPSAAVATSTQPVFSSPNAVFPFAQTLSSSSSQSQTQNLPQIPATNFFRNQLAERKGEKGSQRVRARESEMDSDQGKLFIGGISWETTEDKLKEHFSNYGDVLHTSVMREKSTGKPRGFGFVVFADPSILDRVLEEKHVIDGRTVDAKKAFSREDQQISATSRAGNSNPYRNSGNGGNIRTKKIFVGGLPPTLTEEKFRQYFEAYGHVTDVVVMYDQNTGRPRGFGFISFDTEDAVDRVLHKPFHDLNGKQVEVKRALPKDANPGASGRTMGGVGGGGGYQGYGASGGNQNAYDGRMDSGRYMQPQSTGGGFPPYGSSGYSAPGYGYGPANNGIGYGGYGSYGGASTGYGGPAGATYGNPNVPNAAYAGGPPGAPRSSWPAQAPSGYGSMGYGNTAAWGAPGGGAGSGGGGPGSAPAGQSPSGAAGYGNQGYGYGGYGGYGGSDSSYGNPGVYGAVGGRSGSAQNSNAGDSGGNELQGSGGSYNGSGYGDANGSSGYGNAAWRSEPVQPSGNYGTPQGNGPHGGQVGYGSGYGGAQSRQAQQQ